MAYQAKRSQKVIEDFELVNENGQIETTIHVHIDADSMVEKIRKKYVTLVSAHGEMLKIQEKITDKEVLHNIYEKVGRAEIDLIEAVFGEEDTKKILEFYGERYVEMAKEVMPFISEIILPKIEKIAKQNKKELLSKYNRKQRRTILKRM